MISLFGALSVATALSGAALFLNDHSSGATPYRDDKPIPGNYDCRLELPGFGTLPETAAVAKDATVSRQFAFSRSKAWLDSVEVYKLAKYKMRRLARRIVFGSLATALAGTGYYFDTRLSAAVKDQGKIRSEYRTSTEGYGAFEHRFKSAGNRPHNDARARWFDALLYSNKRSNHAGNGIPIQLYRRNRQCGKLLGLQ